MSKMQSRIKVMSLTPNSVAPLPQKPHLPIPRRVCIHTSSCRCEKCKSRFFFSLRQSQRASKKAVLHLEKAAKRVEQAAAVLRRPLPSSPSSPSRVPRSPPKAKTEKKPTPLASGTRTNIPFVPATVPGPTSPPPPPPEKELPLRPGRYVGEPDVPYAHELYNRHLARKEADALAIQHGRPVGVPSTSARLDEINTTSLATYRLLQQLITHLSSFVPFGRWVSGAFSSYMSLRDSEAGMGVKVLLWVAAVGMDVALGVKLPIAVVDEFRREAGLIGGSFLGFGATSSESMLTVRTPVGSLSWQKKARRKKTVVGGVIVD